MKISYCIAVHNEHKELNLLLNRLTNFIDLDDEIIIQGDQGKVTNQVVSVIRSFIGSDSRVNYVEYPLNNDFATFKNNLIKQARGEFVFLIDADEYPSSTVLVELKNLLQSANSDVFALTRLNVVNGLTQEWIDKWHWKVEPFDISDTEFEDVLLNCYDMEISSKSEIELVNFPDYQLRIWRNGIGIEYNRPVHEILVNYNANNLQILGTEYCLYHVKEMDRQIKQNSFYDKI